MTSRSTAKPRRGAGPITAEAIVQASLRIAARGSGDAFTVRRIGEELGADPTAIYRHFRDKDELFLEVADRMLGEILDGVPSGLDWRDTLRVLARAGVRVAMKYPAIGAGKIGRTLRRHNEFRIVDLMIGTFRDAGLDAQAAALHARRMGDTLNAYCGARALYSLLDVEVRAGDESAWQREYRMVDPQQFPHIAHVSEDFVLIQDDDVLESIMDALIVAAETAAATTTRL